MPHTVSDEEWNHLQARKQVADFVEPIYNDPRFGKEARSLIKKAYPNLQMEGYDLEQRMDEKIDAIRKERDDEKEYDRKRAQDAQDEQYKQERKAVQDRYGFTEDAMTRMEDMMVKRNIGNYEDAATLFAAKEPRPSEPTPGASRYWNHEKQDGFAEISKDPEKWGFETLVAAARRDEERARSRQF